LMSSHDPRILIGLGEAPESVQVTVEWPSRAVTRFERLATNQTHQIIEPGVEGESRLAPTR